jgi:ribosomal protein S18 acetylase RimI-like enzyme
VPAIAITAHDSCPPLEAALVDSGMGASNEAAAPLHEVQPISCFARSHAGQLVGGAVGRRWGSCCELQQLWVEPCHRRRGIATRLIREFEAHARSRGCSSFYLETFSFQAPALYESLGYRVAYEHAVYPHGIVKFVMVKQFGPGETAA